MGPGDEVQVNLQGRLYIPADSVATSQEVCGDARKHEQDQRMQEQFRGYCKCYARPSRYRVPSLQTG